MINWLSIDDISYHWDGEQLTCQTSVGYSSDLDGHRLEGIDITDNSGAIIGQLFVDFDTELLQYHSEVQSTAPLITYSLNGEVTESIVTDLPDYNDYVDLLLPDNDDFSLWKNIADISVVNDGTNDSTQLNDASITYEQVMSESDFTLDHLLASENDGVGLLQTETTEIGTINDSAHHYTPIDVDTIGYVDPLDFLMTYNSNQS